MDAEAIPPEVAELAAIWHRLPDPVRAGIVAMLRASRRSGRVGAERSGTARGFIGSLHGLQPTRTSAPGHHHPGTSPFPRLPRGFEHFRRPSKSHPRPIP